VTARSARRKGTATLPAREEDRERDERLHWEQQERDDRLRREDREESERRSRAEQRVGEDSEARQVTVEIAHFSSGGNLGIRPTGVAPCPQVAAHSQGQLTASRG
jgi:hypothetical protein